MKILLDWFTNVCTQIQIDKSISYYAVYNFCEKTHLYTRARERQQWPRKRPLSSSTTESKRPSPFSISPPGAERCKAGIIPWTDLKPGSRWRGRALLTSKALLGSLGTFEVRYRLPIVWEPSEARAAALIEKWAWYFYREAWRPFKILPAPFGAAEITQ